MNSVLKGSLFVASGATCYGVVTTIVKYAYQDGYVPIEVTFSQLAIGLCVVTIMYFIKKSYVKTTLLPTSMKTKRNLLLAGTSLGLTSTFYYLSVQYISVSLGIVLLMQSVWIGVIIEAFLDNSFPSYKKVISFIFILFGTLLATDIFTKGVTFSAIGIIYGVLAGCSFAITLAASNRIALELTSIERSMWLLLGGFFIVSVITIYQYKDGFNFNIFLKWGPLLAIFGTIFPPLLITKGMPLISLGLGSIISALELPVAIMMAYIILDEHITPWKIIGSIIILLSIIYMNIQYIYKPKFDD